METEDGRKERKIKPFLTILGWVIVIVIIIVLLSKNSQNNSTNTSQTNTTLEQTQSVDTTQTASQEETNKTPLDQIQITNLQLTHNYEYGYEVTGQVTNNSNYPFNSVQISVEAYDCPSTVINSDCSHIGEDKGIYLFVNGNVYGQIPSNQTREVSGIVNLSGMPPIQGNFLWSYTVTGVMQ